MGFLCNNERNTHTSTFLFPGFSMGEIETYSVQFSHSVLSDSLRPHESQHARPPCPSQTPRVYSNSCPSIPCCHPAISSSVIPFSSCPQSLPVSGSFPMSQLFSSGGQSIGVSASASSNILMISYSRKILHPIIQNSILSGCYLSIVP